MKAIEAIYILFSPGEIIDKYTILLLKLEKLLDLDPETREFIEGQVNAGETLIREEIRKVRERSKTPATDTKLFLQYIQDLITSNEIQWGHETNVREGNENAAWEARDQNLIRTQLKDKIDTLVGFSKNHNTTIEKTKVFRNEKASGSRHL